MSKKLYKVEITTVMYVWAESEPQAENIALRFEEHEEKMAKDVFAYELPSDIELPDYIKNNTYAWGLEEYKTIAFCLEEMKKAETTKE